MFFLTGCSISYSVGKSSDSVKSISDSISDSISNSSGSSDEDDEDKEAYRNDVTQFTLVYAESAGSSRDFMREIGRIAESHGITDWEREKITFIAIGAGLRQAGVENKEFAELGFLKEVLYQEPDSLRYLREGEQS
jgi:hypothetical protein